MRRRWYVFVPLALAGIVVFSAIGGAIVLLLWNGLLPALFGFPRITFWQAFGLLVLSRILFGGFGVHGCAGPRIRGRIGERIRERMAERWEQMTPEERERFRQGLGGPFGCGPGPAEGTGL